ncbi:hypothetical protein DQG23_21755 [Paenibacillus contaminans]|uniref:Uncharacterized protein n=1 Tax=Paenibacillus contaminans TaxID=450362 RepID=A0A329MMN5_9BACL|nr:hypothetical protein DQG23_21755 [Paenibacillus contaminans]
MVILLFLSYRHAKKVKSVVAVQERFGEGRIIRWKVYGPPFELSFNLKIRSRNESSMEGWKPIIRSEAV